MCRFWEKEGQLLQLMEDFAQKSILLIGPGGGMLQYWRETFDQEGKKSISGVPRIAGAVGEQ